MAKKLDELLADARAVSREREALRLKAKALQEKIDPLLAKAEAERRANPTPGAESQGVG